MIALDQLAVEANIVITHQDRALGIVTEHDVFRHREVLVQRPDTRIDQIMSNPVYSIGPEVPVYGALERMEIWGVRRLVVAGLDSRLLGVVSLHQVISDRHRRYLVALQNTLRACHEQQFPGQLPELISDGVLIVERSTGRIVETNAQLASWLGYTSDSLTGSVDPDPGWAVHDNVVPL
jgi:predicted transcriptional regulator